jgi:hypothetical protein
MALLRALRRPGADLGMFLRALPYVVAVRTALWIIPSPRLLRWVQRRVDAAPAPATSDPLVTRIGWAVRAASRRVPGASCLTQALAVQLLLARRGMSSELKLGVAIDDEEGFQAHAWVLVEGRALVGGTGVERYTEFPELRLRH